MGVGRDDQGGRYQGVVSSSGWEQSKTTDLEVLACSVAIQQMRGREEVQALYMAIHLIRVVADDGLIRVGGHTPLGYNTLNFQQRH